MSSAANKLKQSLLFSIKIIISGVLLYLISLEIDWNQLTVSFKQADLLNFSLGVLFGVLFNTIKFLKWKTLINNGGCSWSYWDSAKSYMVGNALGIVTPMRAGDLGRAFYFPSSDRAQIIGLTVIDRIMDLAAVLVLCIGGSFLLINKVFGLLILGIGVIILVLLFSPPFFSKIFAKFETDRTIFHKLIGMISILKDLRISAITISLFLSFLAFILIIFQFYYIVSSFESSSFLAVYLATPLITLSSLVPVTFLGLGVREGISVYLFSMLGITAATGFSTAFLGFIINNISISLLGVFFLLRLKIIPTKS